MSEEKVISNLGLRALKAKKQERVWLSSLPRRPAPKVLMCQDYCIFRVRKVAVPPLRQFQASSAYPSENSECLPLPLPTTPMFLAHIRAFGAGLRTLGLERRMQQMSCTPASCTTRIGRMRHACLCWQVARSGRLAQDWKASNRCYTAEWAL